ncbi:MAG: DMT family transporter [Victivallaceae bacterium]
MLKHPFAVGVFWSFASAFLWGTTYIAGRALMRSDSVDPVTMSILRFSVAGLLMWVVGLKLYGSRMFDFSRRDFLLMLAQGTVGMAGMSFLIFWGQRYTTAVNSSMIMTATPVMTMLGGALLGSKVRPIQYAGMAVATAGCFMVIKVIEPTGLHLAAFSLGDLLTFGAAVCWAVYSLWGRETVRRVGGYIYTTYVMLGALPLLLVLEAINFRAIQMPQSFLSWAVVGYIILFPTAGAFFAWNQAQRLIDLSLLNIMQYLTPVTVLALSWPILGEGVSLFQLAGALLVIFGVGIDPALLEEWKRRRAKSCSTPPITP